MSSVNKVILIGNLTRDPELRYTPKGMAIAKVGLAVNRKWKNESGEAKDEVTFIDVDVFGKTAENINKWFAKGNPIMVIGRLKYDQWEDKNGSGKRSKLSIFVEQFQFIGGKEAKGNHQDDEAPTHPPARTGSAIRDNINRNKPAPSQPFADDAQEFAPDDIPF